RNYDYYGLANLNIGLGYHRQLLKHFYPHEASPNLYRRVQHLIQRINSDTLDLLDEALQFVQTVPLADTAAIAAFGATLKQKAFQGQHAFSTEAEFLLREIERAAGVRPGQPVGLSEAITPLMPILDFGF